MTRAAIEDLADALDRVQVAGWPELLPLHRDLPAAEPFPVAALGGVLAPAVDVLVEVVQPPAAIAAQAVLGSASLVTQAHADVLVDGRRVPLSLYLFSVALSGNRKSAADSVALGPVRAFERDLHSAYKRQRFEYDARSLAHKRAAEVAAKAGTSVEEREEALQELGPPPAAPLHPHLVVTEPTYEGLVKLFQVGRPALGLFSDEGGGFLGGHAMSPDHRLRALTGLCELHDGKPISRVRSGDGAGLLFGRRLSLHLMVQPVVAPALLGDRVALEQGFVPRCLVAWPDSTLGQQIYVAKDPTDDVRFTRYAERVSYLLRRPFIVADDDPQDLQPRPLRLAPAAKSTWIKFHDWACKHNGSDGPLEPVRSFAAKLPDHVLRIAGVLASVDDPDGDAVALEQIEQAIVLGRHYLAEALRLHGQAETDGELLLAGKLIDWGRRQPGAHIALVDAYQRGPAAIRDRATAGRVIEILEAHGWVRRVPGGAEVNGQRRRDVWEVRP